MYANTGIYPTIAQPRDLAALKAQLQQQLAAIEAEEQAMQPQSLEDFDVLETKITQALAELKQQKAALKKSRK